MSSSLQNPAATDALPKSVMDDFPVPIDGYFQVFLYEPDRGWAPAMRATNPKKARSEARRMARQGFKAVVIERRVSLNYSVNDAAAELTGEAA